MPDIKKIYSLMMRRTAFFLVLVYLLHVMAMRLDLYYIMPWFDMMMHTLGGVSFGFLLFALLTRIFPRTYQTPLFWMVWVLGGIVVVVGWEVFEYLLYILDIREWDHVLDSINDIFCGLLGGIMALLASKKFFIIRK